MDKVQALKMSSDADALPEITYYGIVKYVINTKSAYGTIKYSEISRVHSLDTASLDG